jgi:hypothetical protein
MARWWHDQPERGWSLSDDITLGPLTAAIPPIDLRIDLRARVRSARVMHGQGRWSPFTRSASRRQRPLADRYHAPRALLVRRLQAHRDPSPDMPAAVRDDHLRHHRHERDPDDAPTTAGVWS